MLPTDLIRAHRTKENILPDYAKDEFEGLAKTLITIYKEHLEKPRAALNEALQNCEELGYDFKLVRGLTEILDSCSIFGIRSTLPALPVRKALFEEAAKYPIITEVERTRLLSEVATRFKTDPKEIEESMYADLLEEQHLIDFKAPEPKELFQRYNFALIISLLTYSTKLSISYIGKDSVIEQMSENFDSKITSGKSTQINLELKPTKQASTRGNKLENILTRILSKKDWAVKADVFYPPRYKVSRLLELEKKTHGSIIKEDPIKDEVVIEIRSSQKKSKFGEIIPIDETANKLGITDRELLKEIQNEGIKYVKAGGTLFLPSKLETIKNDLKEAGDDDLKTYTRILRKHGCKNPIAVLEDLNYLIEPTEEKGRVKVYTLKKG
jgi:predicted nuclease of restriction endonuclease-like RecB superfamily